MRIELYAIACAIIAACLFKVESYFNERYSGVQYYEQKAEDIAYQREQDKIILAKLEQKHLEYQQQLASYIPDLKKENSYVARNIASTLDVEPIQSVKNYDKDFAQAKEYFVAGNFVSAIEVLEKLEEKVRHLAIAPEVMYLLMESYHQVKSKKLVFEAIDVLVSLYPESHLTGYALIRLGEYYLEEDEVAKAKECFQLAIENFSFDKQIVALAQMKMGNL